VNAEPGRWSLGSPQREPAIAERNQITTVRCNIVLRSIKDGAAASPVDLARRSVDGTLHGTQVRTPGIGESRYSGGLPA
jgi:hypothetical protein